MFNESVLERHTGLRQLLPIGVAKDILGSSQSYVEKCCNVSPDARDPHDKHLSSRYDGNFDFSGRAMLFAICLMMIYLFIIWILAALGIT